MDHSQLQEKSQSLWLLVAAPAIWAMHFTLCYLTASIWCAKAAGGSFNSLLAALGVYTALALIGIGIIGWQGYRKHTYGEGELPHDEDTPEDRHRFLGFATLLLSALSAAAVVYAAFVIIFFRSCY